MKKFNYIVVHGGQPHVDDMYAVGLAMYISIVKNSSILFKHQMIHRRNPTKEELDNPHVLVLDVGEKYEPKLLNFDHHQLDGNLGAVHLLLKEYNEEWYDFEMNLNPRGRKSWLKSLGILDNKGPVVAKNLGMEMPSQMDIELLKSFKKNPDTTIRVIIDFWSSRKEEFDNSKKLVKYCKKKGLVEKNVPGNVYLINHEPNKKGFGIWEVIGELEKGWELHSPPIVIFPDDRGNGWGLLRRNEAPGVNFLKFKNRPDIEFVHKNNFILKTKERMKKREVKFLAALAMR